MTPSVLKRCLLLFWSLWFSVVVASNVCDALQELGWLDASWRFVSGNYRWVSQTTARYHPPSWINAILFAGVILWEGSAAVLFWLAWWSARGRAVREVRFLYPAFGIGLMLWAAFLLADELLIAYGIAATHLRLLIAQLLTLLAIVPLPEDQASSVT